VEVHVKFKMPQFRRSPGGPRRGIRAVALALLGAGALPIVGRMFGLKGGTEPSMGLQNPALMDVLAINDGGLAIALACLSLGMALTSRVAGNLVDRAGTRLTFTAGALVCWVPFAATGLVAPQFSNWVVAGIAVPPGLVCVQFLTGVGFALIDIAALRISTHEEDLAQAAGGKAENHATHAWDAFGAFGATVVGFAAIYLGVPIEWHLLGVGVLGLAFSAYAIPRLPNLHGSITNPAATDEAEADRRVAPRKWELAAAATVGGAAAFIIVLGLNWSTVLLDRLGAVAWLGPVGAAAFALASFAGRRAARHIRRPVAVARLCGVGGIGALLLMTVPARVDLAIAGLVVLGFSLAPIAGLATTAAGRLSPDGAKGKGIAWTQFAVYVTLFLSNLVGLLSSALGDASTSLPLQMAIGSTVVFPLLIIALAPSLRTAAPRNTRN
jgi:MFS family permease